MPSTHFTGGRAAARLNGSGGSIGEGVTRGWLDAAVALVAVGVVRGSEVCGDVMVGRDGGRRRRHWRAGEHRQ